MIVSPDGEVIVGFNMTNIYGGVGSILGLGDKSVSRKILVSFFGC